MKTIGILGAGQLGRMLACAGIPLGLRFRFLDPAKDAPAEQIAKRILGAFEDLDCLRQFATNLDLITYEFENVPVITTHFLERRLPVYPPSAALESAQDRIHEKTFFQSAGIATAPFAEVEEREDLERALEEVGLPAVLKTRRFGYDGKGQVVIDSPDDLGSAWSTLGGVPLIWEGMVKFRREVSLIMVRSRSGEEAFYPLVENHHREGMLRLSFAPAPNLTDDLQAEAEAMGRAVLQKLNYVGVLAMELFQVDAEEGSPRLLANEMAPRVHNSGHWSIEGAVTSQFENHLRAILDWPLGSTETRGVSAMVNLIGSIPEPEKILSCRDAHLHDYGKVARPGRKLGHVTLLASDHDQLRERLHEMSAIVPEISQHL